VSSESSLKTSKSSKSIALNIFIGGVHSDPPDLDIGNYDTSNISILHCTTGRLKVSEKDVAIISNTKTT